MVVTQIFVNLLVGLDGGVGHGRRIIVVEDDLPYFDLLLAELDDIPLLERVGLRGAWGTWPGTVLTTSHSSFCSVYC
jgi:hypothetical protein